MRATAAILLLTAVAFAQAVRVPTITRTVQLFGELERKLEAATPSGKAELLSEDFEERLCAEPGTPVPKEEWLQKSAALGARFSQEAVHMYDNVAVYSGLRTGLRETDVIVDTWKGGDGGWKLSVRYRCPASGSKPAASSLPKRY